MWFLKGSSKQGLFSFFRIRGHCWWCCLANYNIRKLILLVPKYVAMKLDILTVHGSNVCSLLAWMWKRRRRGRASWHNNKQETLNIGKTTQKDSSMKRVELVEGELKLLQKIRQQLLGGSLQSPCWMDLVGQIHVCMNGCKEGCYWMWLKSF